MGPPASAVLMGLPQPIKAVAGLVLSAGIALVWRAPAAATAPRWLAAALLFAVAATALLAVLPTPTPPLLPDRLRKPPEKPALAAIGMLLQGGTVAVLGWGLPRRYTRQYGTCTNSVRFPAAHESAALWADREGLPSFGLVRN